MPYLTTAATCDEVASEWVGIDGSSSQDTSLIQAGVSEDMTDPSTGVCTPGDFYISAWWEILPAYETPITSVTVSAGDQVTVTIWQVSGTTWAIQVTDDTNDESFTTEQGYVGPGSSAEWILEAPTDQQLCGGQCQLAPYSPDVTFSDLGMTGNESTLSQIAMVQDGVQVSTPSALSSTGFDVAYSGTQNSFLRRAGQMLTHLRQGPQPRRFKSPIYS